MTDINNEFDRAIAQALFKNYPPFDYDAVFECAVRPLGFTSWAEYTKELGESMEKGDEAMLELTAPLNMEIVKLFPHLYDEEMAQEQDERSGKGYNRAKGMKPFEWSNMLLTKADYALSKAVLSSEVTEDGRRTAKIDIALNSSGEQREIFSMSILDSLIGDSNRPWDNLTCTPVFEAVIDIFREQYREFTVAQVWRTMHHKEQTDEPTENQAEEIYNTLEYLRQMQVSYIRLDNGLELPYDFMLHIIPVLRSNGGYATRAYKFFEVNGIPAEPIALTHAKNSNNEIARFPAQYLSTKKRKADGTLSTRDVTIAKELTAINRSIIRRIVSTMDSVFISLEDTWSGGKLHEGLYTLAGHPELSKPVSADLQPAERKKTINARKDAARRLRYYAELVLDNLKAYGAIISWEIYSRKGEKTIAGYKFKRAPKKTNAIAQENDQKLLGFKHT